MWGTPGTLVASRLLLELTGDERWRGAWQAGADALWSRRDGEGYWTQRLHGEEYKGLGTAHGLVGNVQALRPLLDKDRRGQLERDTRALLARSAFVEEGLANWAYVERPQLASAAGDQAAMVRRRSGDRGRRSRLPRRGAAARRRRAGLAGGTADAGEGRHLRHRRQRLRAACSIRAHRRRGVARPGASLRRACARPGRARRQALLALDKGRRRCGLRCRLPRGSDAPHSRLNPGLTRDRQRLALPRSAARCPRGACDRPPRAATRSRRSARPRRGSRRISAVMRPSTTSPRPGPPTA